MYEHRGFHGTLSLKAVHARTRAEAWERSGLFQRSLQAPAPLYAVSRFRTSQHGPLGKPVQEEGQAGNSVPGGPNASPKPALSSVLGLGLWKTALPQAPGCHTPGSSVARQDCHGEKTDRRICRSPRPKCTASKMTNGR